jgi:hypothetical protein
MSLTQLMIRPEILAEHKATWFVWAGGQRIRRTRTMRGTWGHDVACSCGWDSKTGGATRGSVEDDLFGHRMDAQTDADALAQACPDCEAGPGTGCSDWGRPVSYMHAGRYQAIPD